MRFWGLISVALKIPREEFMKTDKFPYALNYQNIMVWYSDVLVGYHCLMLGPSASFEVLITSVSSARNQKEPVRGTSKAVCNTPASHFFLHTALHSKQCSLVLIFWIWIWFNAFVNRLLTLLPRFLWPSSLRYRDVLCQIHKNYPLLSLLKSYTAIYS